MAKKDKKIKKPLTKKSAKKTVGKSSGKRKVVSGNGTVEKGKGLDKVLVPAVQQEPTKEELQVTIEKLSFQLDQANTQLDQFSHTTSHELQEPLKENNYVRQGTSSE
jgi:hypothetical protein